MYISACKAFIKKFVYKKNSLIKALQAEMYVRGSYEI